MRGQGNKLNVGPKTKKRLSEVSSLKWNLKKGQMELMRWWVLGHTSPLIGAFLVVPCFQWLFFTTRNNHWERNDPKRLLRD